MYICISFKINKNYFLYTEITNNLYYIYKIKNSWKMNIADKEQLKLD